MNKEQFYKTYCEGCGTQRCEGIDTEWGEGCQYRWNLDGIDAAAEIKRLNDKIMELGGKLAKTKPVVRAEWIGRHGLGGYDDYKCSACGMYEEGTRNPNLLGNYCSYCGALMKDDLGQCGKWEFWDGWIGNHDKRIEDATCSKCGYKHHTVRREFQSNETAQDVLNKLSDICPGCGIKMLREKV